MSITNENGAPSYRAVMAWLGKWPEFQQNYARAREESAHANAEKIDSIAERVLTGEIDPNAARVAVDALKWSAGRKLPKKYGDRIVNEVTGQDGGPIVFQARSILEEAPQVRQLEDGSK